MNRIRGRSQPKGWLFLYGKTESRNGINPALRKGQMNGERCKLGTYMELSC